MAANGKVVPGADIPQRRIQTKQQALVSFLSQLPDQRPPIFIELLNLRRPAGRCHGLAHLTRRTSSPSSMACLSLEIALWLTEFRDNLAANLWIMGIVLIALGAFGILAPLDTESLSPDPGRSRLSRKDVDLAGAEQLRQIEDDDEFAAQPSDGLDVFRAPAVAKPRR